MRESNFVPQNLENDQKKENIWNLPNLLTLFRIIFAFVAAYFIFAGFDIVYIVVAFIIGMLTDFFDGLVARTFNLKTEFGRHFNSWSCSCFYNKIQYVGDSDWQSLFSDNFYVASGNINYTYCLSHNEYWSWYPPGKIYWKSHNSYAKRYFSGDIAEYFL